MEQSRREIICASYYSCFFYNSVPNIIKIGLGTQKIYGAQTRGVIFCNAVWLSVKKNIRRERLFSRQRVYGMFAAMSSCDKLFHLLKILREKKHRRQNFSADFQLCLYSCRRYGRVTVHDKPVFDHDA